jgi:hypothetical protein
MVIKYFGPNDKRGVYWPPYTAKERREMEASLYRDHGGPMAIVRPGPRGQAYATNRHTEPTSRPGEAGASTDPPPDPPPGTAAR